MVAIIFFTRIFINVSILTSANTISVRFFNVYAYSTKKRNTRTKPIQLCRKNMGEKGICCDRHEDLAEVVLWQLLIRDALLMGDHGSTHAQLERQIQLFPLTGARHGMGQMLGKVKGSEAANRQITVVDAQMGAVVGALMGAV